MAQKTSKGARGTFMYVSLFLGAVISIWSVAAVVSGLAQVNWQVSELLRQYMIAIGLMKEFHTFVDFYTHIKGIEYILAVAFLCAFPPLYKYLNSSPLEAESPTR